jgi:hypothetical protein
LEAARGREVAGNDEPEPAFTLSKQFLRDGHSFRPRPSRAQPQDRDCYGVGGVHEGSSACPTVFPNLVC